jgi:hypothetical protein
MRLEKAQISTLLADQRKTEKDLRKKANAEQQAKPDGGLQEAACCRQA